MSDLRAFVRHLAETVASHDPTALRSPVAVGEIQSRMMPYRACRRALRLETAEEYELLLLRLVAEEAGLARTYPPESAERCRVEVGSVLPDLAFLEQIQDATILLNLGFLAAAPASPTPPGRADTLAGTGQDDPLGGRGGHESDRGESVVTTPVQPEEAVVPLIDPSPASPVPAVPRAEPTADAAEQAPPRECPHCARTLPQGRPVRFCPSCGQNVLVRLCASCRSEMELDWRHCVMCGHPAADTQRFA